MVFLDAVLDNGEPFSLSLAFGMAAAGLSPVATFFSYFAVQVLSGNFIKILLAFGQAILLGGAFLLGDRLYKTAPVKKEICRLFTLAVCLVGFVLFSLWCLEI